MVCEVVPCRACLRQQECGGAADADVGLRATLHQHRSSVADA